jgi:hypothetical protein
LENTTTTTDADSASENEEPATTLSWPIATDEDVIHTFRAADQFFREHLAVDHPQLKRPTILLHVQRDPNAPPAPPRPLYLEGMADPEVSESMTMLSFYAFPPKGIASPNEFAGLLKKLWKPFDVLGRVYVATEGVNAQMGVPTNV